MTVEIKRAVLLCYHSSLLLILVVLETQPGRGTVGYNMYSLRMTVSLRFQKIQVCHTADIRKLGM